LSELRRIATEDDVVIFGELMAGKAPFVHGLVGRLAILKISESSATCRAIRF
jgi:tRNA A37 threonylcarbamoyladenosine biosynthesis protein TsaE